jgi:geranylgeranyl diphosphate synthase type II
MDFRRWYASHQKRVEAGLKRVLPPAAPARLRRAMGYSLWAGGKRLRPVLVLAAAEACGAPAARVLPAALGLECLHTYSLIHDDLPAMDDDDLRRGRPTCHKAFDEATAILAGDGLLTLAFELLARNARVRGVPPGAVGEAVRVLAVAAGAAGMVGGQLADIQAEGRRVTLAGLKAIHAGKTGALIRAAAEVGGLLAGGRPFQRRALRAYGRHIGLAFQVADDILNVVGEPEKLGKATGSDAKRGKATYPALLGLQKARLFAQNELQAALRALKPLGRRGEPLAALARFVVERDS